MPVEAGSSFGCENRDRRERREAEAAEKTKVQPIFMVSFATSLFLCDLCVHGFVPPLYHTPTARPFGETILAQYVPPVPDTIVTRAPTRIDFGGGWTDVPPYSDEMGGYVCNVAIARYVTVAVEM